MGAVEDPAALSKWEPEPTAVAARKPSPVSVVIGTLLGIAIAVAATAAEPALG